MEAGIAITKSASRDLSIEQFNLERFEGVTSHSVSVHRDHRGALTVFEQGSNLPFDLRRVYIISEANPETARGSQSVSADRVFYVIFGEASLDFDNGHRKLSVRVDRGDVVLRVKPGVWLKLRDLSPEAVVLVFASQRYEHTTAHPEPHL